MTGVREDMNPCQSNSRYGSVAPEISELDDGVLHWKEEVDPSLRQRALEAVEASPMQAIRAQD